MKDATNSPVWPRITVASTTFLAVLLLGLSGCAVPKFESEPPGPQTAEVTFRFHITSLRSVGLGGVFAEGRECRGFRVIGLDGRVTPTYSMRVKPETLSMIILSTGEAIGSPFIPGGVTGKRCGGTYSFDPRAGSRYAVHFFDEPNQCGVSLLDLTSGQPVDISHKIVRRDAKEQMPGTSRCADEYMPR